MKGFAGGACLDAPVLRALLLESPAILPDAPGLPALSGDALIGLYDRVYPEVEKRMWRSPAAEFDAWLARYQALFREQQALIDRAGDSAQRHFLIAITVADRPAHARACLESIHAQCTLYGYGGRDADGCHAKLTVVLAEDSREARHVEAHRALAREYQGKGLRVVHFDLPEQYSLLQAIPEPQRRCLARLLTDQPADRFYRKGQAANRNLAYLKLQQLTQDKARTLYYLVDSDQAFAVNVPAPQGEASVPALNYFYVVDRIFRDNDIRMLTGKLVGDPPVSPAVMAANFLDDVAAFLRQIGDCDPHVACTFHDADAPLPGDAAYHDMAGLFGFGAQPASVRYRCPIEGPHDHAACLATFAGRLRAFFFGEHLTRKTGFRYAGPFTELAPARTVYPGNYVVDYAGLKYIIPFGHLRLRMSGPTAGRLIRAEIGARFASANLPMLHRRTAGGDLADAFRPGVDASDAGAVIDIADEFERQFFGDLMLFSVERWLQRCRLDQLAAGDGLDAVVTQVEDELLALYAAKHQAVRRRCDEIGQWLSAAPVPGQDTPERVRIEQFLRAIDANFGAAAPAWRQIQSAAHRAARRSQIVDALRRYRAERAAWDALFP